MPIIVQCPECGKKLKVPDTVAGKRVRCPNCPGIVAVPEAPATEVSARRPISRSNDEVTAERPRRRSRDEAPDEERPRKRRPRDDDYDDDYDEPPRKRRPRDEEEDEPRGRGRRDRDEEEDRPRRRKGSRKKKAKGPNMALILGIVGGAVALVAILIVVLVFTMSGGETKDKKQASNKNPSQPGPNPGGGGTRNFPPRSMARPAISNNMKLIGLALHNYANVRGAFPPVNDGKLSWRVHILPYLEQDQLYKKFDLNQRWDHPANKKLIHFMPSMYRVGGEKETEGYTHLRRFEGPKIPKRLRIMSFRDGPSNTFLFVEASEPVIWTKPDPLVIQDGVPLPDLGYAKGRDGGFHVVFADGSCRFIRNPVPDADLRALILPSDGRAVRVP